MFTALYGYGIASWLTASTIVSGRWWKYWQKFLSLTLCNKRYVDLQYMVTVSCCQKLVVLCCIEDYIGQTTPVNSLLHWKLYGQTKPVALKITLVYKACCIEDYIGHTKPVALKIILVYKACCIEDYIGHTKPVALKITLVYKACCIKDNIGVQCL